MDEHARRIAMSLSLRSPQKESLDILARVTSLIPLKKDRDLVQDLKKIKEAYPSVEDFERAFPSLCFDIATGVGKTRLMGAFIAYLHIAKGVKNFFVLAPNLTIYNKLIKDFTKGDDKYVLTGMPEFGQASLSPIIITGDTYENFSDGALRIGREAVCINIFNISKINAKEKGEKTLRIKRLREELGESYFNYLVGLDDLVLLMDEAHRYRASAGVRVIDELNPVLGLELTATAQVESGEKPLGFKNVLYNYPLPKAMKDGFVKELAAVTQTDFNPKDYAKEDLERIKLEDGVGMHEKIKVELENLCV